MNLQRENSVSPIVYLSKQYNNGKKQAYYNFHRDFLRRIGPSLEQWANEQGNSEKAHIHLKKSQKKEIFHHLKQNCRHFLQADFLGLKDFSLQHYLDQFYFQIKALSRISFFSTRDLQAYLLSFGCYFPSTFFKKSAEFLNLDGHKMLAMVSRIRRLTAEKMAVDLLGHYLVYIRYYLNLKHYQNKMAFRGHIPSRELKIVTRLKKNQQKVIKSVKKYLPRVKINHLLKVLGVSAPGIYLGLWKCKLAIHGILK